MSSERHVQLRAHRDAQFEEIAVGDPQEPCDATWSIVEVVQVYEFKGEKKHKPLEKPKRKQYINVEPSIDPENEHPDYGRVIRLKAMIVQKSGGNDSLAGKTVYWRVVPGVKGIGGRKVGKQGLLGKKNRQNLPTTMQASFDAPGNRVLSKASTTGNDGWTIPTEFHLSKYGGDIFTIHVSMEPFHEKRDPKSKQRVARFEVWRKIFVEVDFMMQSDGIATYGDLMDYALLSRRFEKYQVEPVYVERGACPAHQHVVSDHTWPTMPTDVDVWAKTFRKWRQTHAFLHLIMVDTIGMGTTTRRKEVECVPNAKGKFLLEKNEYSPPNGGNARFAPNYCIDIADWFDSATYAQGESKTLLGSLFNITQSGSNYEVTVNLQGVGVGLEQNLVVTLNYRVRQELDGFHANDTQVIVIAAGSHERRYQSNVKPSIVSTMMHEIGHALGLAAKLLPDGDKCKKTVVSINNEHHCERGGDSCIMYYASTSPPNLSYCKDCGDSVRGREFSVFPIKAGDGYK